MKEKILLLFKTVFFVLLASVSFATHLQDNLLFSAKLTGDQEVPSVTTSAVGVGSFMLNNMRNEICINIAVNGLSGPITGAHIHEGAMGVGGPVIMDLSAGINGNQLMLMITGATITSDLISKLINGETYVNIHTAANPNGEIRGQIMLETDHGFVAAADGLQEVPIVITTAYGLGVFTLNKDENLIEYLFIAQNLSGAITGAHLHIGAVGVSGGVEQDLSGDIVQNVISGSFIPSINLLAALKIGEVYINVHTAMNPGGEIRGQVLMNMGLPFDAMLNGAQEVPSVITNASGVASFTLNSLLNEITYDIVVDGLSGAITGSHIHGGSVGVSGGVLVDLSSGINGNRITGTIPSVNVTQDLINAMLKGETYVNVHTAANPGGEVRGQIYRLAREGYTTVLNGAQEDPSVITNAYGAGIVSINRDQNNLHYMFVVGGLSSAILGAHFHNAVAGVSGSVIFDLTSSFSGTGTDDAAFGYLTSLDGTPFTSTESLLFRNDEVYVNVHNAENLSGEIRGQINSGQVCYSMPASVEELNGEMNHLVYPNPFKDQLIIISDNIKDINNIRILDLSGKIILSQEVITENTEIHVNTEELQIGSYLIKTIYSNGTIITNQIVKMK